MSVLTMRRPDDVESGDAATPDKRKLLLIGVLAAVLVLALGYFLVLPAFGGSSSDSQPNAVAPRTPRSRRARRPRPRLRRPR